MVPDHDSQQWCFSFRELVRELRERFGCAGNVANATVRRLLHRHHPDKPSERLVFVNLGRNGTPHVQLIIARSYSPGAQGRRLTFADPLLLSTIQSLVEAAMRMEELRPEHTRPRRSRGRHLVRRPFYLLCHV